MNSYEKIDTLKKFAIKTLEIYTLKDINSFGEYGVLFHFSDMWLQAQVEITFCELLDIGAQV